MSGSRRARDREADQPVTADTLFAIGSVTKAFTATTVGALVDEGRLGEASHSNRAGIPLYLLFVANEICALAFMRRGGAR